MGTVPRQLGFAMPAEWAPHAGCWMIWPERPDNWRLGAKPAQAAFTAVASAIARFEPVTMLVSARQFVNARAMLPEAVRVVEVSTNDAWARDVGPSFLLNAAGELAGVDWPFNAWGGLQGGLYFPWDLDDQVAAKMLQIERARKFRAPKMVEGGAIHVDGEGTVLVTEACLLAEDRNPGATRQEMERVLKDYLGVSHVIWLVPGCRVMRPAGISTTSPASCAPAWCCLPGATTLPTRITKSPERRRSVCKVRMMLRGVRSGSSTFPCLRRCSSPRTRLPALTMRKTA